MDEAEVMQLVSIKLRAAAEELIRARDLLTHSETLRGEAARYTARVREIVRERDYIDGLLFRLTRRGAEAVA